MVFFFFNDTATTEIYTLSLHDALPIFEPISAVIGAILVTFIKPILPFVLGFAAGAMIYVVAEELIPSGKTSKKDKFGTIGVMIGFILMMVLDIALG